MRDDELTAFERLYSEEFASVFRAAYLITGDRSEAVDLTQEAFVRAYERWNEVSRLDRPGAWVQRVAVNLALSWRRRARVWRRVSRRVAAPEGYEHAAGETELIAMLRSLPPAERAVVVLRYCLDQSVEETARTLGKPAGTVRSLSSKATARMRNLVADEETVL